MQFFLQTNLLPIRRKQDLLGAPRAYGEKPHVDPVQLISSDFNIDAVAGLMALLLWNECFFHDKYRTFSLTSPQSHPLITTTPHSFEMLLRRISATAGYINPKNFLHGYGA